MAANALTCMHHSAHSLASATSSYFLEQSEHTMMYLKPHDAACTNVRREMPGAWTFPQALTIGLDT
jgi:hypothetical protein